MEVEARYMSRALELAARGYGFVSPNPMVGCVIVHPQAGIVGEGWHRCYGSAHAEVNAVRSMDDQSLLPECTVYVTLEPCAHYGKTPPCADMLIERGVRRVVVGSADPFSLVDGKGICKMRSAGVEVVTGVMTEQCDALNVIFMTAHRLRRPYVMLKWAQTADGYVDAAGGTPVRISTAGSMVRMHRLRAGFDAIAVGTNTVINDNPQLTVRLWPARCNPRPVLFNVHGRLPLSAAVMHRSDAIIVEKEMPVPELLHKLYERYGITSLLVEGGPGLLRSFADAGCYDAVRVEVSDSTLAQLAENSSGNGLPAPVIEGLGHIPLEEIRICGGVIRLWQR